MGYFMRFLLCDPRMLDMTAIGNVLTAVDPRYTMRPTDLDDLVEVLYDDTDQRAGAKFAAADLIGVPWQILVGPKGLADGKLELKRRSDGTRENLSPAEVVAKLTA